MDVRDQDAAELLRVLLEELRSMREQTNALLEEIRRGSSKTSARTSETLSRGPD